MNDLDDIHPLDRMEIEEENSRKEFVKKALYDSSLVYGVFATPNGQKLIERWVNVLLETPTANKGDDLLTIGMNEGYKAFIRSIIQAIAIHEDNQ